MTRGAELARAISAVLEDHGGEMKYADLLAALRARSVEPLGMDSALRLIPDARRIDVATGKPWRGYGDDIGPMLVTTKPREQ